MGNLNDNLVEERRTGCINTSYSVVKASLVILYVNNLKEEGLRSGVDYFVLGEGKFRQIHIINK
jgi:hypothetical protein